MIWEIIRLLRLLALPILAYLFHIAYKQEDTNTLIILATAIIINSLVNF